MDSSITLTRWSLNDLLAEPIDRSLDESLSKLEQALGAFEAMRGWLTLQISAADFNKVMEAQESISTLLGRIEGYTDLWFAEDTQNQAALNLQDRIDQVLTDTSNRLLFFEMWFKDLPDDVAADLIKESGDLRYYLESMRRFKPYTLSEVEERMINLKDVNGIDAMVNLYQMITNHFTFNLTVDGDRRSLTRDQVGSYFQHPSAELRAAAYQELYRVYQDNATVLAQIYIHRARDWYTEAIELRGYASPIAARNVGNDLPDAVVDTLLSVCRQNAGLFQRYFKLKAHWLGIDKLRRYDIYAPLAQSEKKYDYSQARQMVMDSYQAFSPQVADLAKRVFDENHLDSEPRPGKRGGAFSYAALPELTPWVLINYDGRARDIATLAHELGHAVHAMLSSNHSVLTHPPSLPLAETASVFAEMQLTEQLLNKEKDPTVRRDLLVNAMDDAYVTVMRQAYFTVFEKDAHAMIVNGESIDKLTQLYLSNLEEQFGDAIELSDEFKWEWISIPHIYNAPFYTYAYSFGQLLVLALYQQYKLEGAAFIPRYLRILSYGGSESPMKILSEAGLDIASSAFWQGGFDMLEKMLAELEGIA
jgi:oligoendopeptidase F